MVLLLSRLFYAARLKVNLHGGPFNVNDKNYQVEDAADEGEMPPLECAEEDASRMEEVRSLW